MTADQPLKPDFNGEKAENPAQNVVTGPLLATAPVGIWFFVSPTVKCLVLYLFLQVQKEICLSLLFFLTPQHYTISILS